MPKKKPSSKQARVPVPKGYEPLKGSERHPASKAKLLGPADPKEIFSVTIVLRRRPDGPPVPSFDYFAKTHPSQRRRLSQDEFAAKYGAAPQDIEEVMRFASANGLKVVKTHAARRAVVVSGTVAQMSKAFAVALGRYKHTIVLHKRARPQIETYRGRDGAIHVPKAMAKRIVGVFGLDNRRVTRSNGTPADPPNISTTVFGSSGLLTVPKVAQAYNFPNPGSGIAGQTIGIVSAGGGTSGYFPDDITNYFNLISIPPPPQIIPISVDGAGNGSLKIVAFSTAQAGTNKLTIVGTPNIVVNSILSPVGGVITNVVVSGATTILTVDPPLGQTVAGGTTLYLNFDQETTQDICISGSAAPGATVAVYFSNSDQNGWVDLINRVIHPESGDFPAGVNPPSILSSSDFIAPGDDSNGLLGTTTNMVQAVDMAFQDAAIQGITVCVATGDSGSTSGLTDGFAHVQYPASDPWVLAVGGTTLGGPTAGSQPPPWLEYMWNDIYYWGDPGATGGGVSAFFPVPSYQNAAGINPQTINPTNNPNNPFNATGRGVPDVAGNASGNSGYPLTIQGYTLGPANGTSASTPLWAGLIALINSNLEYNVGFLNPFLYQLGPSIFNPINPLYPVPGTPYANCPTDNGIGVTGYPATAGWDACTGLGSPNGMALLNALQTGLFFIVDQDMFGLAAVQARLQTASSAIFDEVFFVVMDGFTPQQLGISVPGVSPSNTPNITGFPNGMTYSLASFEPAIPITATNLNTPQRFTFAYNVSFTSTAISSFPVAGQTSPVTITANFAASGMTVSNMATLLLDNLPAPYFAGGSGISWLSNDVRVFQIAQTATLNSSTEWFLYPPGTPQPPPSGSLTYGTGMDIRNTGNAATDATNFIQSVIQTLTAGTNVPSPGTTPPQYQGGPVASWFDWIPTGEDASELDDLSVSNSADNPVYNFAIARVRFNASATAQNVRAFFRLIPALNVSTAYDLTTTYRRWTDGSQAIPLFGIDPSTGEVISIPCFASPRVDLTTNNAAVQTDAPNVQTITANSSEVDVYFGCWLDINQLNTPAYPPTVSSSNLDGPFPASSLQTIQQLLRNEHQCLIAEIAHDLDPIAAGSSPSTSGPLAQRNLSLGNAANPGVIGSRRVPNTFMVRPTAAQLAPGQRPDELMIDWGDVPAGSVASIYWPSASASAILQLAKQLYGNNDLAISDSHTITLPTGGISYAPIPPGTSASLPGLITVDLPLGIRKGQSFDIVLRQVTNVGAQPTKERARASVPTWRRTLGSFQITIQVETKDVMLVPEERSLSVMRWIQEAIPATSRWAAVFQRYVAQIAERVSGVGGNPALITASPSGQGVPPVKPVKPAGTTQPGTGFTGKVIGIKYDRFGDFEGFALRTEQGAEHCFQSREYEIEALVQRAWSERIRITVFAAQNKPHEPESIVFLNAPRQ